MEKICCIYKVTNDINNKIYIGATNDLKRRIVEHKRHAKKDGGNFHKDIIKYGYEVFHYEIIEKCMQNELSEKEKYYISLYRNNGEDLYNICKGGAGGQTHDISGKNNPMYGKHKTAEEKQHLSNLLKNRKKPDGFGDKISKALKGVKKNPEVVARRSHPIKVIDIETGSILLFKSKSECRRHLGVDGSWLAKNPTKAYKNKYKLYIENDKYTNEGQTTIESIAA